MFFCSGRPLSQDSISTLRIYIFLEQSQKCIYLILIEYQSIYVLYVYHPPMPILSVLNYDNDGQVAAG